MTCSRKLAPDGVLYQDYNKDVLTSLTIPNLSENLARRPEDDGQASARFFSGGWRLFKERLRAEKLSGSYDYILSSDTIYSLDSQQHLLDCISEGLRPGGTAFIAAKSYYFGVGGGVDGFKVLIDKSGEFDVREGTEYDDGASNRREVFLLIKK